MRKFCVYIHRRPTDGKIFYVGKGFGKRPYTKAGRNEYWHRIVDKHGYSVEIVLDNAPEACCFTYEMVLIAAIGRSNLCNSTDGGQGTSGRVPSKASRLKCSISNKGTKPANITIQKAIEKTSKPVGTRCGLRFASGSEAARFFKPDNPKAGKINILQCANGKTGTAYGYEWGFVNSKGDLEISYNNRMSEPRPLRWKAIRIVGGQKFDSITKAVDWLRSIGHTKARTGGLCRAVKETGKIYGYRWEYV